MIMFSPRLSTAQSGRLISSSLSCTSFYGTDTEEAIILGSTFHTFVLALQMLTMNLELAENAMCFMVSLCPCFKLRLLKKSSFFSCTSPSTLQAAASYLLFFKFWRRYCPFIYSSVLLMKAFSYSTPASLSPIAIFK